MSSIAEWDDEYARVSRAASQLRTTGTPQHPSARQHQVRSVQTGLSRLKSSLMSMRNSGMINSTDVQRRIGLIDNLERQVNGSGSNNGDMDLLGMNPNSGGNNYSGGRGGGGPQQSSSLAAQALRHQDEMIDELAVGVSRLKDQTMLVNDEARMQNRMLDDMDGDVEIARHGLEAETMRALKLKEDQSVWRLYLIIAGLSVLLFILIMSGLG